MAENGRILHHLKHNIEAKENTILLVSFMAEHTLGRRLKDGADRVRIFGEEYDVRATVETIDGYSAHADQDGLVRWAMNFDRDRLQNLFIVHGEPDPARTLAGLVDGHVKGSVDIPVRNQSFEF